MSTPPLSSKSPVELFEILLTQQLQESSVVHTFFEEAVKNGIPLGYAADYLVTEMCNSEPWEMPKLEYDLSPVCVPTRYIKVPEIANAKHLPFVKNPEQFLTILAHYDCRGKDRETLLHEAAVRQDRGGLAELVLILKKGIPLLNAQTEVDGFSPLHLAAIKGIETLVEIYLNPYYLYDGNKPENWVSSVALQTKLGRTALHLASSRGHKGVVLQLLQADPTLKNVKDKAGLTAADYLTGRLAKGGDLSHLGDPLQKQKYLEILTLTKPDSGAPLTLKEIRASLRNLRV